MSKYIVEGNINFYDALHEVENSDEEEQDSNRCLITDTPLQEYAIQLECGHKFNYEPLFHDIKTHKYYFNNMEGVNSRLALNEIRCPYCRRKQNSLLPYLPQLGLPKINGVNHFDPSLKNRDIQSQVKCVFQVPSLTFNDQLPVSDTNQPFQLCGLGHATKLHPVYFTHDVPVDNKCYCATHKAFLIKQFKEAAKEKAKQEKLAAKEKAKQEKIEAKEKAKQEKLAAKEKAKQEKLAAKEKAKQEKLAAKEKKELLAK